MRLHDGPADGLAHVFGEQHRVLGHLRSFAERLQDRDRVANRHPLPQKILKHSLDHRKREHFWNQILHHLRIALSHPVAEVLGVLPAEEFVSVAADHFGEMRSQHADVVHHRVALGCARARRVRTGIQSAANPNAGSLVGLPSTLPSTPALGIANSWPPGIS